MKRIYYIIPLSAMLLCGCREYERGQYPVDSIPPGQVSAVKVQNMEGEVVITYTIPEDVDLLYVKAVYRLDDGRIMDQKSSAFGNQIRLEGFGRSREQTIQLICGDRSKNESQPVEVVIHPLNSRIYEILETIEMREDFGGIRVTWENPDEKEIALVVLKENEESDLEELQTFYSKARAGRANLRGLPSEEMKFNVYIRDRWDNRTDTLTGDFTPIFEEILDKSKFAKWNPTGIPYADLASEGWTILRLWDDKITDPGFSMPVATTFPANFTFDMGQTATLSRFKLHQRQSTNTLYSYGNPKKFEVWGSPTADVNQNFSTWIKLGEFESYKPSGLPSGETSDEDLQYAHVNGEDYEFEIGLPAVRYIRFVVNVTWGGNNPQLNELSFYGNIQEP